MWRRSRHEPAETPEAEGLAVECEMYLSGGYRQYLESRSRPVPAWAWINQLAHGDRADIEAMAASLPKGSSPQGLMSAVARRLVAVLAQRDVTLATLQRRKLIPLA